MKISLVLGTRGPVSRQTAWGCLTSNLALPGAGSLAAGRRSGYVQMLLAFVGLGISTTTAARFFFWYVAHFGQFQEPGLDQFLMLVRQLRWPIAGLLIFGLAWAWSLVTSCQILRAASPDKPGVPPKLV